MLSLDIKREIATCAYTIAEYAPEKIMNEIFESIHDLHANTSLIAPHEVKSIKALRYLFHVGYDQIPRFCLQIRNGQWIIRAIYVRWLARNNCLSLVREMFLRYLGNECRYGVEQSAIEGGSLDVLEWLLKTGSPSNSYAQLLSHAVDSGQPDVVNWMIAKIGHLVNWEKELITHPASTVLYKVISCLRHDDSFWRPRVRRLFLIYKGDLDEIDREHRNPVSGFSLKSVVNEAAIFGHLHILKWIYQQSRDLPEAKAVERACQSGHLLVLQWIYELDPTAIISLRTAANQDPKTIYADVCSAFAVKEGRLNVMDWIYHNFPDNVLPNVAILQSSLGELSEDTFLKVFDWFISVDAAGILPMMVVHAAILGHVPVLHWLHEQRIPIEVGLAKAAAHNGRLRFLMAIHDLEPELLRNVEIAHYAAEYGEVEKYEILEWMWKTYKILPTEICWEEKDLLEWIADKRKL